MIISPEGANRSVLLFAPGICSIVSSTRQLRKVGRSGLPLSGSSAAAPAGAFYIVVVNSYWVIPRAIMDVTRGSYLIIYGIVYGMVDTGEGRARCGVQEPIGLSQNKRKIRIKFVIFSEFMLDKWIQGWYTVLARVGGICEFFPGTQQAQCDDAGDCVERR